MLDVTLRDYQSRIRTCHAAENFTVMRHIDLNGLWHQETTRLNIKARRLKVGWDTPHSLQAIWVRCLPASKTCGHQTVVCLLQEGGSGDEQLPPASARHLTYFSAPLSGARPTAIRRRFS